MTNTQTELQELANDITRSARVINENVHDVGANSESYDFDTLFELRQVQRMAAEAIGLQVERTRRNGATWETIGEALNISRQAAQQAFGA